MKKGQKWLIGTSALVVLGPIVILWGYEIETSQRESVVLARLAARGYSRNTQEPQENIAFEVLEQAKRSPGRRLISQANIGVDATIPSFQRTPELMAEIERLPPNKVLWFPSSMGSGERYEALQYLKAGAVAFHQKALDMGKAGHTEAALREVEKIATVEKLIRTEGSGVAVITADGLSSMRSRVVIQLMLAERSLPKRSALAKKIPMFEPLDARGALASTLSSFDRDWRGKKVEEDELGPFGRVDAFLMRLRPVDRRVRVVALEGLLAQAEFADDGAYKKSEAAALAARIQSLAHAEKIGAQSCLRFSFASIDFIHDEARAARANEYLAVADLLCEQVGGSIAQTRPGVTLKREPGKVMIHREGVFYRHTFTGGGYRVESARNP